MFAASRRQRTLLRVCAAPRRPLEATNDHTPYRVSRHQRAVIYLSLTGASGEMMMPRLPSPAELQHRALQKAAPLLLDIGRNRMTAVFLMTYRPHITPP